MFKPQNIQRICKDSKKGSSDMTFCAFYVIRKCLIVLRCHLNQSNPVHLTLFPPGLSYVYNPFKSINQQILYEFCSK